MNVIETEIKGLLIVEPDVFVDDRGFFEETYNEERYGAAGIRVRFVQDNLSLSGRGVLRGLHYQAPPLGQGKLVQVLRGGAFDVAVDIRDGSPTFGKYVSVELSADNHRQFWIPVGFAHGFLALEDDTIFQYKCTSTYSREHDCGIRFDDPDIGIAWPDTDMVVSEKDRGHPLLRDAEKVFRI